MKFFVFLRWIIVDYFRYFKRGRKKLPPYGLHIYVGLPGKGKTISMVEFFERMRKKYPDIKIYTNFHWLGEDGSISSWKDMVSISNGPSGVIFGFDEIQNTFSQRSWKDFPPELLEQISYSRKDRKLIIGSSQDFDMIDVVLRRYCNLVIRCNTLFNRWTFQRAFSRLEYESMLHNYSSGKKAITSWRYSFVQSDYLRSRFDTFLRANKLLELASRGELTTLSDVPNVPIYAPNVIVSESKKRKR